MKDEGVNLKSSMDRFIAYRVYADGKWYSDLKSSMDRFIEVIDGLQVEFEGVFKIQYG